MEQGFVLYPTYNVASGKPVVQLFGKLENGETFRADIEQVPYFFIKTEDVENAKKIVALTVEDSDLLTMDDQPVSKVTVAIPKDVPPIRTQLQDAGIPCYEADVRFAYRYLIDNSITSAIAIEGEYKTGVHVDRIYTEPKITKGEWKGELTVCSLDIETDKRGNTLWAVALTQGERQEQLVLRREGYDATNCTSERDMLEKLNDLIQDMNPDIITGWNVIGFDLNFLQKKYDELKVPWAWARSSRRSSLRIQSDYFRTSTADIPGRQVLDGIDLLRMNFIKLESYTLESASQTFLGEGKLFKGKGRHEEIGEAYEKDPKLFLEYNMKDTQLVLDILEKTNVLNLTIRRSLLTGMQLDRVRASIASLDNVYLPRLRAAGHVAPSSNYVSKTEQVTGGFVMSSKPGIYDYVIVCDFKSLYPSIMRTFNIDPLAYKPGSDVKESTQQYLVAENGAVFEQGKGILPAILKELSDVRDEIRAEGDEIGRYAIKILMNSFWGVLASPNCRFFSLEMGNAITHSAQHAIKETIKLVGEMGYEVIYGDTDSVFIDLAIGNEKAADKIGKEIQDKINAHFKAYIKEKYKTESFLEMEYEKNYIRFLMPTTRSGEGSKKRYAGLLKKNGKEDIEFVGLEFVRRDWTDLAKTFQMVLLDRIFHKKDPRAFIKQFVEEVREGKHDDQLVYKKALRKKIEEYTKTTPPHVKAAMLMDEVTSNLIEYVQTVDGPEPITNTTHSLDYEHYIEKQIKPIADSVLGFYGTNFEDVLAGTQQKGLFEF